MKRIPYLILILRLIFFYAYRNHRSRSKEVQSCSAASKADWSLKLHGEDIKNNPLRLKIYPQLDSGRVQNAQESTASAKSNLAHLVARYSDAGVARLPIRNWFFEENFERPKEIRAGNKLTSNFRLLLVDSKVGKPKCLLIVG